MKSLTKKLLAGATVSAMLFSLTACGGGTDTGSASGSAAGSAAAHWHHLQGGHRPVRQRRLSGPDLQQHQGRAGRQGQRAGVTFDYKPYFQNGEGDATVINQIASDLVADGRGHHRPHRHPHRRGDADRH